jgi:hypothetical protein
VNKDDLIGLNAAVDRLRQQIGLLEARVAKLEGASSSSTVSTDQMETIPASDLESAEESLQPAATRAVFLLGRSILILAGAFLLRALTDGGVLPSSAGIGLGVAYPLAMILLADRVGAREDRAGALGYGLTAVLVAYPFLVETIGILKIVSSVVGGLALAVLTGAGLLVAARRYLRLLAWAFTLAALVAILTLNIALDAPFFFTSLLLALGVGTLLLAYTRGWRIKRWFPALAADAVILRFVVIAANPDGPSPGTVLPSTAGTMALALTLLVVYLGIFTFRAVVQNKGVRTFYVTQSMAVLLIGFGGAVRLAQSSGGAATLLGWLALAAASAYYAVAFTFVRQRHGRGRGFFYFASLALVFLVLGSRVVAADTWLAWSWIGLGLAAALLGGRFDRVTLRAHSAIYLVLAAWQTGLTAAAWDAFLGGSDVVWSGLDPAGVAALLVTIGCYGVMVWTQRGREISVARRVPNFCIAVMALSGLGWGAVWLLVQGLGEAPPAASPATVAVIRTGVLAATAVALAWVGRRSGWVELTWLVYPLLALGCVKLLIEDLRRGTPLTLTVGFALFGTALILAPRMMLAGRKATRSDRTDQAPFGGKPN